MTLKGKGLFMPKQLNCGFFMQDNKYYPLIALYPTLRAPQKPKKIVEMKY
jgi:hypothetical protein